MCGGLANDSGLVVVDKSECGPTTGSVCGSSSSSSKGGSGRKKSYRDVVMQMSAAVQQATDVCAQDRQKKE